MLGTDRHIEQKQAKDVAMHRAYLCMSQSKAASAAGAGRAEAQAADDASALERDEAAWGTDARSRVSAKDGRVSPLRASGGVTEQGGA